MTGPGRLSGDGKCGMILKRNEERRVDPMKDTITKLTLETLEYRKKQLEWKAGQVERLLSGREKSLLPLLRDEKGNYSEEKTRALAEELIEALDLYRRFRRYPMAKKDKPLSDLPPALEENERRFFRSFLYCLLRLAEDPPADLGCEGTFGDLLDMARDVMFYQEREVFCLDTVFRKNFASDTWRWMDCVREKVTGVSARDAATQEDIDLVEKFYPKEASGALEEEQFQEELDEEMRRDPALAEEFSEAKEEWEIEEEKQEEQRRIQWLESFPDKEVFCREYESWKKDYFGLSVRYWLDEWMEEMLEVYLYREGRSSFLADDTYFSAYALLDRAVKQLRKLLDGEG